MLRTEGPTHGPCKSGHFVASHAGLRLTGRLADYNRQRFANTAFSLYLQSEHIGRNYFRFQPKVTNLQ